IDALGQYVAPGDHEGIYHVVATSRTDPSKTGVATVTVQRLDLIDHGGTVAAATRTFALWWGDDKAFPPDARPLLESLLQGLDGPAQRGRLQRLLSGSDRSRHLRRARVHRDHHRSLHHGLARPARSGDRRQVLWHRRLLPTLHRHPAVAAAVLERRPRLRPTVSR